MIFQDPMMTLNPFMRVDTQMIEAMTAHQRIGRGAARARAKDMLTLVGIPAPEERLSAYPHQLSGGMRQRVAIATAMLNGHDLIIADEPTTALDVTIQAQILNLFMDLREDLDDLGVVHHVADRIVIMYLGRIVESAPTAELFKSPNHPYTQALLREVPRIDRRGQDYAPIEGELPSPLNPPPGCHFHPRCPFALARCREERPQLKQVAPGRFAACHLNDGA